MAMSPPYEAVSHASSTNSLELPCAFADAEREYCSQPVRVRVVLTVEWLACAVGLLRLRQGFQRHGRGLRLQRYPGFMSALNFPAWISDGFHMTKLEPRHGREYRPSRSVRAGGGERAAEVGGLVITDREIELPGIIHIAGCMLVLYVYHTASSRFRKPL